MTTETKATHTPTPWEVDTGGDGEVQIWSHADPEEATICEVGTLATSDRPEVIANARRIALAVNHHDALADAMQSAISLIDNGDSNKARAVLDGALGDLDDAS